eukprot:TRINITY_DN11216_c1_g1_i1.p1 TRINITY_DN11216_c1_g1~~TRINITY_DN11216_c1_g1_i1.p1  ORF type:complete len:321 (-),score=93.15 TRINITY_DN11216_c1_g1_i1:69-1031(-)
MPGLSDPWSLFAQAATPPGGMDTFETDSSDDEALPHAAMPSSQPGSISELSTRGGDNDAELPSTPAKLTVEDVLRQAEDMLMEHFFRMEARMFKLEKQLEDQMEQAVVQNKDLSDVRERIDALSAEVLAPLQGNSRQSLRESRASEVVASLGASGLASLPSAQQALLCAVEVRASNSLEGCQRRLKDVEDASSQLEEELGKLRMPLESGKEELRRPLESGKNGHAATAATAAEKSPLDAARRPSSGHQGAAAAFLPQRTPADDRGTEETVPASMDCGCREQAAGNVFRSAPGGEEAAQVDCSAAALGNGVTTRSVLAAAD